MTIRLKDSDKIRIINSQDVFTVMQAILKREDKIDKEKEHFWMIGLNTDNRILYIELVSLGSVKAMVVEPMNIFRVAVLKGAVKVIMAHNHPSGTLIPSDQDKDLTDRLIQVGHILNIDVVEHLIITPKSYYSFVDTGLLEQLSQSNKWVPKFELIERIRKEEHKIREELIMNVEKQAKIKEEKALEIGKTEGIKEGKIEMAKAMLEKDEPISKIIEYTGLAEEEIMKL
jgi:DNA repair protein RadC